MRRLLERLALETHLRLYNAERFDVSQSEETITEINLLEIAIDNQRNVYSEMSNKHEEAWSGVDWEWWIYRRSRLWLRVAIQAKKLTGRGRYSHVLHQNANGRQIDLLRDYAVANDCVPLYCLYNFPRQQPQAAHWHCCRNFDEAQLGCSLVPLAAVEAISAVDPRPTFEDVHRNTAALPWRCLSCRAGRDALGIPGPPPRAPTRGRKRRIRGGRNDGPGGSALPSDQPAPSGPPSAGSSLGTYSQLPSFLGEWLAEKRGHRYRLSSLPEDFYKREVGPPKRIAVLIETGAPHV